MSTIQELLYSNYIKYDRLSRLCSLFKPNSYMDVYVDVYSMIKSLYNRNDLRVDIYTSVTSSIINLCAHYRYFLSNYGIDTTFYIINSQNTSMLNKTFCPEYNAKIEYAYKMDSRMNDIILSNISLLETLCPYLPDVHFINSVESYETGSIISYIMDNANPTNERYNVIITRDIYNYQLVQRPNTFILRPKKTPDGDMSYIINNENVMKIFLWERKNSIQETILNPGLLSTLIALSNCPERNIKSLLNINTALLSLEDAVKNFRISNNYNFYINSLWEALNNINAIYNIGETGLTYRFKAVDLIFQSSVYSNTAECSMLKFDNLYDPEGVKRINEQYFENNPLDLEGL